MNEFFPSFTILRYNKNMKVIEISGIKYEILERDFISKITHAYSKTDGVAPSQYDSRNECIITDTQFGDAIAYLDELGELGIIPLKYIKPHVEFIGEVSKINQSNAVDGAENYVIMLPGPFTIGKKFRLVEVVE